MKNAHRFWLFLGPMAMATVLPLRAKADTSVAASLFTAVPVGNTDRVGAVPMAGTVSMRWRPGPQPWAIGLVGGQHRQGLAPAQGRSGDAAISITRLSARGEFDIDLDDHVGAIYSYVALDVGCAWATAESASFLNGSGESTDRSLGLALSPELGLRVPVSKRVGLGMSVRYDYVHLLDKIEARSRSQATISNLGLGWQLSFTL